MKPISFRTVVIDPPWPLRGAGKCKRGADKHYPLLDMPDIIKEINKCPYWECVEKDSHMYLWVTNGFLPIGLKVMEALGYRYITNICWNKNSIGLGQYFRGRHELCLFGVRGRGVSVRTDDRTIPSVIDAKKTGHSRKPDAFYKMVEQRSIGPYLDMFARSARPGWVVWGDEVDDDQ
jgi:N6-adenosine-specific RNA methylase IME4